MITYLVIAGVGLALLLASLVVGVLVDEIRIGGHGLSGSAIGDAAVVFGLVGALAVANDLSSAQAAGSATVGALIAAGLTQRTVNRLADRADPPPLPLTGAVGVLTAPAGPDGGEVALDGPREHQVRLAWSDEALPPGTRVVVVSVAGNRLHVARL
ncbi:MAG: NfeD family protein [Cellulomonas sp.]